MKILLLTNYDYRDFVVPIIHNNLGDNKLHIYFENEKFFFDDELEYDVGISFMYQYKVPKEEIDTRPWINFHPAPLPEYKGRNLCYHAIMNGEKEFGATVHYMDENFDTGDIIEVLKFSIPEWATAEDLSEFAINASKQLFQLYFPRIIAGEEFERIPNVGGTYYPKEPIDDYLFLSDQDDLKRQIRAITYKEFYPKLDVNGVTYKIVRDE